MLRTKLTTMLVISAAVWPAGAYAISGPVPVVPDGTYQIEASAQQDLRSPPSAGVSASRPGPSVSDGFEWGDAGIGAALVLALVSLASGTVLVTGRSRHGAARSGGPGTTYAPTDGDKASPSTS